MAGIIQMLLYQSEIAEAIRDRRAVLFFGAGISKFAGLPLWGELLEQCIGEAEQDLSLKTTMAWIRESPQFSDPLLVAELMQRKLGVDRLNTLIENCLTPHSGLRPSRVHAALAALRWNQILTSNYDDLLEKCYASRPPVLTWRSASEYLKCLQRNETNILKLHGTIEDRSSLILSRSEFSALQYEAPLLAACLSCLLLSKSFVFVGYSLRDPDFFHLVQQNQKIASKQFGPHYLLLPEAHCSFEYSSFLEGSCGIKVIPIPHKVTKIPGSQTDKTSIDWTSFEEGLVTYLRGVDGYYLRLAADTFNWNPHNVGLSLKARIKNLLTETIEATGSLRGDVCFEKDEFNSQLERFVHHPYDPNLTTIISPNGVMGAVFLNRRDKEDFIYIRDVCSDRIVFDNLGYRSKAYYPCDPRVKSEIAIPIYSDGRRSGVLNLEAGEEGGIDRYSPKHIEYLQGVAERIGAIRSESLRLTNASNRFRQFFETDGISKFTELLTRRRAIAFAELQCVLYQLDYENGKLVAHSYYSPTGKPQVTHDFGDQSLAARVLRTGTSEFEADAVRASKEGRVDPKGIDYYSIVGPVAGFPIRLNGVIISVLVTWRRNTMQVPEGRKLTEFRVASERAHRITKLLAVDDDANLGMSFISSMDKVAQAFDRTELQTSRSLQASGKLDHFYQAYLGLLLDGPIGFTRLRLWIRDPESDWQPGNRVFQLSYSLTSVTAVNPDRDEPNAYRGRCLSKDTDVYTQLTIERSPYDPYSRRQHRSVFGVQDENCDALDKNPDSEWAVVPLIKKDVLWGFISGEVDQWDKAGGRMRADRVLTPHQHFALDVIAHTISSFQPKRLNHLWDGKASGATS